MAERVPARLSAREGRSFGLTVGAAFLVLAAIMVWRDHATPTWIFGIAGGALVLAGLAAPTRLGPVQRGWMRFALAISKVTTPIIMGIAYFLIISPVGFVMRLLRKNPMTRRESGEGYWVPRGGARSDMRRQF